MSFKSFSCTTKGQIFVCAFVADFHVSWTLLKIIRYSTLNKTSKVVLKCTGAHQQHQLVKEQKQMAHAVSHIRCVHDSVAQHLQWSDFKYSTTATKIHVDCNNHRPTKGVVLGEYTSEDILGWIWRHVSVRRFMARSSMSLCEGDGSDCRWLQFCVHRKLLHLQERGSFLSVSPWVPPGEGYHVDWFINQYRIRSFSSSYAKLALSWEWLGTSCPSKSSDSASLYNFSNGRH